MKRDTGSTEADYAQWLNDNDNIPAQPPAADDDDVYSEFADKYAEDEDEEDEKPSR